MSSVVVAASDTVVLELMHEGVLIIDPRGRIRHVNSSLCEMFGYEPDDLVGRDLTALLPESVRADHSTWLSDYSDGSEESRYMGDRTGVDCLHRSGRVFRAEAAISNLTVDGAPLLVAVLRDLRDLEEAEESREAAVEAMRTILDSATDGLLLVDRRATIVHMNKRVRDFQRMYTGAEDFEIGESFLEAVRAALGSTRDYYTFEAFVWDVIRGRCAQKVVEWPVDRTGGYWLRVAIDARDGGCGALITVRDVTVAKNAAVALRSAKNAAEDAVALLTAKKAELAHAAMHDSLTGLANRALLVNRLDRVLAEQQARDGSVAVLLLDLDHLKNVNDRLGHEAGDRLLVSVAERLSATVRDGDTVARFGGDEFIVLAEGIDTVDEVMTLADRIMDALRTPVRFGRNTVRLTASMGIAYELRGDVAATVVLRRADSAMYAAKRAGRDRHEVFDEHLQASLDRRLEIEESLRRALDQDELEVYYQPIMDLGSGDVAGVEALLRWNHPTLGWVSPAEFIPVAEDSGQMDCIGAWVLRQACAQAVEWRRLHLPAITMAVNVSARQLVDSGFSEFLAQVVAESGIDPCMLGIEVTETALIERRDVAVENLEKVRRLGVFVSLDDFGTGYASLSYLRDLPITHIKIDRCFTAGLATDRDDSMIIRSTIELAHGLGRRVIAEGVENAEQLRLLEQYGCDEAQGYHLGHPQPAGEIEQLLGFRADAHAPVAPAS